ncbi:venom protease-like [Oppia nitens]|uniref:venom protease-like n=1 Tax=Oppia nitens TaxID=1686743 RepID=UPI0023DA8831|nr:venom protease-like [Oppia nitens]
MWTPCRHRHRWPPSAEERSLNSMMCCSSDTDFQAELLTEIDTDRQVLVTDNSTADSVVVVVDNRDIHHIFDDNMDDVDNQNPQCGVSRFVAKMLAINMTAAASRRRSNIERSVMNLLYPMAYRIVMGYDVHPGQSPWMTTLYYYDYFVCGAAIIDHWHVVTAAHCFDRSRRSYNYYIRVGSVKIFNGTLYTISAIHRHHRYSRYRIYHDIAIIRLSQPIVFTSEVGPICLPLIEWLNRTQLIGESVYVAGYGDTAYEGQPSSLLQEVDLLVLDNEHCEYNYMTLRESRVRFPVGIKRSLMCAGYEQGGKDACQGDSGGPLTYQYNFQNYLLGIVSFGYQCGLADYPGVYTYVPYYLDWIYSIITN